MAGVCPNHSSRQSFRNSIKRMAVFTTWSESQFQYFVVENVMPLFQNSLDPPTIVTEADIVQET